MQDADHYDDDALKATSVPSFERLVTSAREIYREWLREIDTLLLPAELQDKAPDVIGDLRFASGLRGTQDDAVALARNICLRVERAGQGQAFYARLMGLYSLVAEEDNPVTQAQLLSCLAHHHLYAGDAARADVVIEALLELGPRDHRIALLEAMIPLVSAAVILNGDRNGAGKILAEQILDVARLTGEQQLLGSVYSLLAQYYINHYDHSRAFEYALLAFCTGVQAGASEFIANGLHYMGLARMVGDDPGRALPYLDLAAAENQLAGDVARLALVELSRGTCYFRMQQYARAAETLVLCLRDLEERGFYYAQAWHVLGLALTKLHEYAAAEDALQQAARQYDTLHMHFDKLSARHALAHLYWTARRYAEAVEEGEQTLAEARALEDSRRQWLLDALEEDVQRYRADRERSVSEKPRGE